MSIDSMVYQEFLKVRKQFDPKLSLREELANSQDAGASRINVVLGYAINQDPSISPFIIYQDDGSGMTFNILENVYTDIFSSVNFLDYLKTGKFGIGANAKYGAPFENVIITTKPQDGDPLFGEKGMDPDSRWRVIVEEIVGALPIFRLTRIGPTGGYCFESEIGTSTMQIFEPIDDFKFHSWTKEWMKIAQEWVKFMPTPVYMGVAEDWDSQQTSNDANGVQYTYRTIDGVMPELAKINVEVDAHSALDEKIVKAILPGFEGIQLPGTEVLEKYGYDRIRYFTPAMIAKYWKQTGISKEQTQEVLDALTSIRQKMDYEGSKAIIALDTFGKYGSDSKASISNNGIKLWKGTESNLRAPLSYHIDSHFIHHDMARKNIIREGKRGEPYQRLIKEIKRNRKELYSQFFSAIDQDIVPINVKLVSKVVNQILEPVFDRASKMCEEKYLEDDHFLSRNLIFHVIEKRKWDNAANLLRKEITKRIGEPAIHTKLVSEGEDDFVSIDTMLESLEIYGRFFIKYPGDHLFDVLREYNIPVFTSEKKTSENTTPFSGFVEAYGAGDYFFAPEDIQQTSLMQEFSYELSELLPGIYNVSFSGFSTKSGRLYDKRYLRVKGDGKAKLYNLKSGASLPVIKSEGVSRPMSESGLSLLINPDQGDNHTYFGSGTRKGMLHKKGPEYTAKIFSKLILND